MSKDNYENALDFESLQDIVNSIDSLQIDIKSGNLTPNELNEELSLIKSGAEMLLKKEL